MMRHDPPVHYLDTTRKCIVCGGVPTCYLEVIFTTPDRQVILDMQEAPVCNLQCAQQQYVTLVNQGFCANATDTYKRVLPCKKPPQGSSE